LISLPGCLPFRPPKQRHISSLNALFYPSHHCHTHLTLHLKPFQLVGIVHNTFEAALYAPPSTSKRKQ